MAKRIDVEEFGRTVATALGDRLVSLILYGSVARSSAAVSGRGGGANTLLICDPVDPAVLSALEGPTAAWVRSGHPAPIILSLREWRTSADAFAIEYEDIRAAHRVIAGRDPWAGITVRREDVQRQLEQELMGKLVRLRQVYVAAAGDAGRLTALVAQSASGFFTMLRTLLRLMGRPVPADADALLKAAAAAAGFPPEALQPVAAYVEGRGKLSLGGRDPLAAAYLAAVARTAEFVNDHSLT
jgi:hypothetical protein